MTEIKFVDINDKSFWEELRADPTPEQIARHAACKHERRTHTAWLGDAPDEDFCLDCGYHVRVAVL